MPSAAPPDSPPLRVKFLTKHPDADVSAVWRHLLPGGRAQVGGCEFLFHRDERRYDWLVAYDDLPPNGGGHGKAWAEELACDPAHTLLITQEPSSIKVYGRAFLNQFAWVVTSQEAWAVAHPGAIRTQLGLAPFYAGDWDQVAAHPPTAKTELISTVCSSKQQRHTLHHARFAFTRKLKAAIPELEVFGRGVRPMKVKNEALDAFRYHIAIENHVAPHHITEKLPDVFLGHALPFYHGAPNAGDYYPPESFIPIDILDFESALAAIRAALAEGAYDKRLPALREARRLALEQWGTFPQLARLIGERHGLAHPAGPEVARGNRRICNRHRLRGEHPLAQLTQVFDVARVRAHFLLENWRH